GVLSLRTVIGRRSGHGSLQRHALHLPRGGEHRGGVHLRSAGRGIPLRGISEWSRACSFRSSGAPGVDSTSTVGRLVRSMHDSRFLGTATSPSVVMLSFLIGRETEIAICPLGKIHCAEIFSCYGMS